MLYTLIYFKLAGYCSYDTGEKQYKGVVFYITANNKKKTTSTN